MGEHYPPARPAEYARGVTGWVNNLTYGLWHVLEGGRIDPETGERYARPHWRRVTLCGASIRGRSSAEITTDPAPGDRACAKCARLLAGSTSQDLEP